MKWKDINNNYKSQIEILKMQTPYERLGISYGATIEDAKKAYRKKISLYHPDRTDSFMSTHGEEVSKLLNEAVEKITKEIKG